MDGGRLDLKFAACRSFERNYRHIERGAFSRSDFFTFAYEEFHALERPLGGSDDGIVPGQVDFEGSGYG